jgi:hypothetical protein
MRIGKYLRKSLAILMVLAMLSSSFVAFASTAGQQQLAAETLHKLGLLQGIGDDPDGTPNFALGNNASRLQGLIMFLRFIGEYDAAVASNYPNPFEDVVGDYNSAIVAYAFAMGYTNGVSPTSFDPSFPLTAAHYLTFVLRAFGYDDAAGDFAWGTAWELTDELGITQGQFNAQNSSLNRGELAIVSLSALLAEGPDGTTLLDTLIAKGAIDEDALEDILDALEDIIAEVTTPEETTEPPEETTTVPPPFTGGNNQPSTEPPPTGPFAVTVNAEALPDGATDGTWTSLTITSGADRNAAKSGSVFTNGGNLAGGTHYLYITQELTDNTGGMDGIYVVVLQLNVNAALTPSVPATAWMTQTFANEVASIAVTTQPTKLTYTSLGFDRSCCNAYPWRRDDHDSERAGIGRRSDRRSGQRRAIGRCGQQQSGSNFTLGPRE